MIFTTTTGKACRFFCLYDNLCASPHCLIDKKFYKLVVNLAGFLLWVARIEGFLFPMASSLHLAPARRSSPSATRTIVLVESYKNAHFVRCRTNQFMGLSTDCKGGFTAERCKPLKGRNVIVLPDYGAFDDWAKKAYWLYLFVLQIVIMIIQCMYSLPNIFHQRTRR